ALITEAAFPARSLWPLAPLGIALLLLALRGAGMGRAFLYGWLWGAVFFLVHFWWAVEAAGYAPWALLGVFEGLFIGAFAAGWVIARRGLHHRPVLLTGAAAALWVAFEALRGVVPFGGMPWGGLA